MHAEFGEYSLRAMLKTQVVVDAQRQQIAERVVDVIRHLHSCKIVHADVRPDHFYLVGSKWKLMDLSRAVVLNEPLLLMRGAQPPCYCAPEVADSLVGNVATAIQPESELREEQSAPNLLARPSLDAWGIGLTLYELFSFGGEPLFAADASHLHALVERRVAINLGHVRPVSARHLLEKLLSLDADARASLDDIVHHAWLAGGLDTVELGSSFSGLQQAQEVTQRQLGRFQAALATNPTPYVTSG